MLAHLEALAAEPARREEPNTSPKRRKASATRPTTTCEHLL
jgi:hypothetical protein